MAAQKHLFPRLAPTTRVYTAPVVPANEFQGLNGAVTTIAYGTVSVDAKLEMTFKNISDDDAWLILENYRLVSRGRDQITGERDFIDLNGQMQGISNFEMASQISLESGSNPELRYAYASPPTVTSVFPGRSTVKVQLRGYLEGAKAA